MTRAEAAQWLTAHGRPMSPSALGQLASRGNGPRFTGAGRRGSPSHYAEEDLRDWLNSHAPAGNGHDGSRMARHVEAEVLETTMPGHGMSLEAARIISDFLEIADRVLEGGGSFADGVRYATRLAAVRKLVRRG